MTNREKFAEQILDIACNGSKIAVSKATLEPIACYKLACKDCLFGFRDTDSCTSAREKWANSKYVEPSVDWAKVPVDTQILVRDYENHEWIRRYFARYVNGEVLAWRNGTTSWSTNHENVISWKYAKLAESEGK